MKTTVTNPTHRTKAVKLGAGEFVTIAPGKKAKVEFVKEPTEFQLAAYESAGLAFSHRGKPADEAETSPVDGGKAPAPAPSPPKAPTAPKTAVKAPEGGAADWQKGLTK